MCQYNLAYEIEKTRRMLNATVRKSSAPDHCTLSLSKKLDELIIKYQKNACDNLESVCNPSCNDFYSHHDLGKDIKKS